MNAEEGALLRSGLDAYLARRGPDCPPRSMRPLPYDFERFHERVWHLQINVELVTGDLRDLTNVLNHWWNLLSKWFAWQDVLKQYSERDAWLLRREFLESDIHQCLFYPSALRDAIVHVATQGIHQARLALGNGYKDVLKGDPEVPGKEPKQYPRSERELRLLSLLSPWPTGATLMERLKGLDDEDYRNKTFDYRNEHSHAIGPRLGIGLTGLVTRLFKQDQELVELEAGAVEFVDIPGKVKVCYGFGGRSALDLAEAYALNLMQYQVARECFEDYVAILDIAREQLPLPSPRPAPATSTS